MYSIRLSNLLNDFVCFDYETRDPFIDKGMGGGWVYAINYPKLEYNGRIVGLGTYSALSDKYSYYDSKTAVDFEENILVGHNLIYDLGWHVAGKGCKKEAAIQLLRGMNKRGVLLIDTILLAKLINEHDFNYSLGNLAKKYKVTQKNTKLLADTVFDTGLYSEIKSTINRKYTKRPSKDSVLLKIAYQNMDKLPQEVVKEYCIDDVKATVELYKLFIKSLVTAYGEEQLFTILKTFSTLQYAVLEMRIHGIAIDNNLLRENHKKLCLMLDKEQKELNDMVQMEVNTAASASLVDALQARGYDLNRLEKTSAGNYSVTQRWLEDENSEFTNKVLRVRKLNKIIGTFIDSLRTIQDELELGLEDFGKVHGEFKIFGTHTGRFSSSNPNLQQIPKRDPEFYEVCRSMFVAENHNKFVASDYSNQEQRIQVHYGYLLKSEGAAEVAHAWKTNPELDFHQKVADICGIDRRTAKTINLGKSYGMGDAKLCKSLGLNTQMKKVTWHGKEQLREVAGQEGLEIIDKYNTMFPFLREATEKCRSVQKERGYIRSLGGRHLHPEMVFNEAVKEKKYFKAFSQLIQGSAADMTIKAIVDMYDYLCYTNNENIKLVGCVHDELMFVVNEARTEECVAKIKEIMEGAYTLEVPMLVDIEVGDSWYVSKQEIQAEYGGQGEEITPSRSSPTV